jgi:CRP-like cAMP-binding protein
MPLSTPGALRVDPLLHSLDVDVCDAFISSLIDLRVRVQENFANNLLYSSEERLACALSSIAQSHKDAQAWPKVTQQELANMIGVTRQRVKVLRKRFSESGWSFIALIVLGLETFSGQHPHEN